MIERTLFSICSDETRFHPNGVFFESNGSKARMMSTDGISNHLVFQWSTGAAGRQRQLM